MSNTKKWEAVQYRHKLYIEDGVGNDVCIISDGDITEQDKKNAALIAAAPDLLREAKRYLPLLEHIQENDPDFWQALTNGTGIATVNGLKYAINKAETP